MEEGTTLNELKNNNKQRKKREGKGARNEEGIAIKTCYLAISLRKSRGYIFNLEIHLPTS